jgi:hypothetical protein
MPVEVQTVADLTASRLKTRFQNGEKVPPDMNSYVKLEDYNKIVEDYNKLVGTIELAKKRELWLLQSLANLISYVESCNK